VSWDEKAIFEYFVTEYHPACCGGMPGSWLTGTWPVHDAGMQGSEILAHNIVILAQVSTCSSRYQGDTAIVTQPPDQQRKEKKGSHFMPDTSTIHCKDNQVSPDEKGIEEMPVLMLDYMIPVLLPSGFCFS